MDTLPLLIEGVSPEDVTPEFLADVMDVADKHGLSIDGISVRRSEADEDR